MRFRSLPPDHADRGGLLRQLEMPPDRCRAGIAPGLGRTCLNTFTPMHLSNRKPTSGGAECHSEQARGIIFYCPSSPSLRAGAHSIGPSDHWTVQTFTSARDAKEFLVSRIVTEAQREGVPLSEIEKKMLYFSETSWTLPDIAEVNNAFDREYDQAEYEQKIGKLIRNMCADMRANDQQEFDAWTEAVRTIRREDHYLVVLIDGAESLRLSARRLLKRLPIALVIACVLLIIVFWFVYR